MRALTQKRDLFAANTRNCAQARAGPCVPGRRASRVIGGDRMNQSACRGVLPHLVLRLPWPLINASSQFPSGIVKQLMVFNRIAIADAR